MIESTHNITYFLSSRTRLTTEDPLKEYHKQENGRSMAITQTKNTIKLTALSIDYQNQIHRHTHYLLTVY